MNTNSLLFGHDDEMGQWILNKLPYIGRFGDHFRAIGVTRSKLIAAAAYHDYHPDCMTMQFTVASISPLWAHPETIHLLLKYPFEIANVHRLSTYVYFNNTKAVKLLKRLGFKQEAILDSLYGKNHHAYMFRLLRPEYAQRYYGDKNKFRARDQVLPAPTAAMNK